MNKIRKKQIVCSECKTIIKDLNRHFGKDSEGKTRCYKHIHHLIPKEV